MMLRAIWLAATVLFPATALAGPSGSCPDFFVEFSEETSAGTEFLTRLDAQCASENLHAYGSRFADILIENGMLEFFTTTRSAYLLRAIETYHARKLRPVYLDGPIFQRILDQVDANFDAQSDEDRLLALQAVHFLGVGYEVTSPLLRSWRRYDPDLAARYQPVCVGGGTAACADDPFKAVPEPSCTLAEVKAMRRAFYTAPDQAQDWLKGCRLGIANPETPSVLKLMREAGILDARCSETVQYNAIFSMGFAAAQDCDNLLARLPELSAVSSTDLVAVKRYGARLVQSGRLSEGDYQRILQEYGASPKHE